jgi:hypothetical protein
MWKPLAITSGLLTLAAGGIMFTQVKNPLKAERTQEANAKIFADRAAKHKTAAQGAKAQAETDLTDSKALLDKNTQAKIAANQAKEAKLEELAKAETDLSTAEKELADLDKKLKDYGGLEQLAGELKQLEAKKAELSAKIAGTKDNITATIAHKESTDKLIAAVKERDLWQKTGTMAANFTTRVRSVNNELGFVELGAGDSRNVVKQAKLFVMRGATPVGRLIVSHLEPNSSIAKIVPGSVAVGDSILPGDLVVVDSTSTPAALKTTTETSDGGDAKKPADKKAAPAPGDVADPFAVPGGAAPAESTPAPATDAPPADGAAPAMEGTNP